MTTSLRHRPSVMHVFLLAVLLCSALAHASGLEITDDQLLHVHPEGAPFEIGLSNGGRQEIDVQWVDHDGKALSSKATLKPGDSLGLRSPSGRAGYYGLRSTTLQGQRETGFAVLPQATVVASRNRNGRFSSPFGMVHADAGDPYLDRWVKTATWETYPADQWAKAMQARRDAGKTELPIVHGKEWQTDASEPVSDEQLQALKDALLAYFSADPLTIYWEMGIEENLLPDFRKPHYWPNLDAKMRVAREAADEVNPNIQFIYQIAETDASVVQLFLSQPVAQRFSILSLHPYRWPDFENPELWLPSYLAQVQGLQKTHQSRHAIWMTEVGAPQHINPDGGLFNFGQARNVHGHSRGEAASYMGKLVVIALHSGVEKVFWYNYRDRGNLRADPENFFGLRDYEGFPKPVYLAWHWISSMLHNAQPDRVLKLSGRVQTYRFVRGIEMCAVAWSSDERQYDVEPVSLLGKQSGKVLAINLMGQPLPRDAGMIRIGSAPILACTQPD